MKTRLGMAIPIVLTFVVVIMVFGFSIVQLRTESKRLNLLTFHYLKANMMAQAGIQHAMMKIRLCPDEAFEAAARQYGICPLNDNPPSASGSGNKDLMNIFISDMNCSNLNISGAEGWGYEVKNIETKAAFRKQNRLVTVVEITAEGWAVEGRGNLQKRTETVKKTISIFKNNTG